MKKVGLLFILLASLVSVQADSFWFTDLENQNIDVNNVESYFSQWVPIDDGYSYVKTSDYVDNIGLRHIDYKQYYNGDEVKGSLVMVHAKNNIVYCVNGGVMYNAPSVSVLKTTNPTKTDNVVIISVNTPYGIEYKAAYKTIDKEKMVEVYIDVNTGEVIKKIPLIYNFHTSGAAYTLYNGAQTITCDKDDNDGLYRLYDNERKILTLDATKMVINECDTKTEDGQKQLLNSMLSQSLSYSSKTNKFYSQSYLKSITISSLNSDWWSGIGDSKPDLFIQIKDEKGNLIAKSEIIDDTFPPITFNFKDGDVALKNENYTVEVYDYDPMGNDFGGSIRINNITPNTYKWNGTNHSGQLTIYVLPLCDAHWGMEQIYDCYLKTFNRKSFDDKGSLILQFLFPAKFPQKDLPYNALASTLEYARFMLYGQGDNVNVKPYVCLDIMAHEFTHLVTACNGHDGLISLGESGALNESFSDIFACVVEHYVKGNNANWTIAEDIYIKIPYLRSLSNPKDGYYFGPNGNNQLIYGTISLPDTYLRGPWIETTNIDADNGGVHYNCGVQNKWFYLLTEGGSGTNDNGDSYSVNGIGIDKAAQIAYRNLTSHLYPEATFMDARIGSIESAKELYKNDLSVLKAVTNAWYAVGVGDEYEEDTPTNENIIQTEEQDDTKYMIDGELFIPYNDQLYNSKGVLIKK